MTPLQDLQLQCDLALQDLEKLFKDGAQLTLLMRFPGNTECELLFTKDDLQEVAAAIQRFIERDAKR